MDAFHWVSNERQRCGKDFTRIKHTCYDVASDWSNIQGSSPPPQPTPREIQLVNVSIVVNLNVTDAITARLRPQTTPNTRPRRDTLSEDRPNIRLETVKSTRSARVGDPITVGGWRRRRQMTNVGLPLVERRTSGQRVTVRFSWCPARVGRHNGACPPRKALPPSILGHRHRRCTSGVVAQRRPAAPRANGVLDLEDGGNRCATCTHHRAAPTPRHDGATGDKRQAKTAPPVHSAATQRKHCPPLEGVSAAPPGPQPAGMPGESVRRVGDPFDEAMAVGAPRVHVGDVLALGPSRVGAPVPAFV